MVRRWKLRSEADRASLWLFREEAVALAKLRMFRCPDCDKAHIGVVRLRVRGAAPDVRELLGHMLVGRVRQIAEKRRTTTTFFAAQDDERTQDVYRLLGMKAAYLSDAEAAGGRMIVFA